jgi:glycosyltransferase involved in cell wall biosynthesis
VERTRIGILVVAYNADSTLRAVLDRIPESFRPAIDVVLVSDDHSTDATYDIGLAYKREHASLPIVVVRQRRNLGYGGNQKFGYRWLIDHGIDVAVLLHGDGQYAPEVLPEIVAPLVEGRADVVLGSRMLGAGALAGGMPLYKFVGNKVLTRFQNRVSGLVLSEWHSGYRAFALAHLERIPFEENSDGFDFDTEVLLQLYDSQARIEEVPIPTYYGDEICRVNGLAYARDVSLDVVRYRLARLGFGASRLARWSTAYAWKDEVVAEGPYDVVVAADVLEHLRDPAGLLRELHGICAPDAILVASVPNVGHWYPRLRIGLGRFDYDHRGILDATHLRFFTWRSFAATAYRAGWRVERRALTGVPLEILDRPGAQRRKRPLRALVRRLDRLGRTAWPSLFAYQYIAVLTRDPARMTVPDAEEPLPAAARETAG